MCDSNQYQDYQDQNSCEITYVPKYDKFDVQRMGNFNNQKQYCPPSCSQCPENQQQSEFVYYDPNQNACCDYEPQQNDECCGNIGAPEAYQMQSCDYQPEPNGCPQNYEPQDVEMDDHRPNICPCPQKCQNPVCSPFSQRKYIQPPRQPSCKPIVCYQKPTVPISNETIYRKSFEGVDPETASCCRLPPIRRAGYIKNLGGPFEKETVTKLSFQPYCKVERTRPIVPQSPSLLGTGPMQGLTTQMHDFVPKFQYRRLKVVPRDGIKKMCGCVEKTTVQRLSFIPPCVDGRRESFRPAVSYKKPELPMESETTQKLSFLPVCPAPREDLPWAKKPKYQPPTIGFAKDTVTKLSYQAPGCFVDECINPNQLCCDLPQIQC